MNISHLRYALEVEKTGSITQAADNLFMGQPNLSKAIKELEAFIGIPIFKRTFRGVIPTVRGKEFLARAREILFKIDELEQIYAREDQAIRFSVCVPRASYISYAFTRFAKDLGLKRNFVLDFQETSSEKAIERVAEGYYNLGIIRYELGKTPYYQKLISEKNLKTQLVWEGPYVVLMSEENELAGRDVLTSEDLHEAIQIVHGDLETNVREKRNADEKKEEIHEIRVYERGSQFDLLHEIPDTYMWVSPVPPQVLKRNGLVQRACPSGSKKIIDLLIYPEIYHLTELDKLFIQKVQDIVFDLYQWT